jgi:hypothetical protein
MKILKNFKYHMSLKNHFASIVHWRQRSRSKVKVTFLKVNISTHRRTLKDTLKKNFKIAKRRPNMLATTYKKSGDVFFVIFEILNNVCWKTCKNPIFRLFYYIQLAGAPLNHRFSWFQNSQNTRQHVGYNIYKIWKRIIFQMGENVTSLVKNVLKIRFFFPFQCKNFHKRHKIA